MTRTIKILAQGIILILASNTLEGQQFESRWSAEIRSTDRVMEVLAQEGNYIYYVKGDILIKDFKCKLAKADMAGKLVFAKTLNMRDLSGKRLRFLDIYYYQNRFIVFSRGTERFKGVKKNVVYATTYNLDWKKQGLSKLVDSTTINRPQYVSALPFIVQSPDRSKLMIFNWQTAEYIAHNDFALADKYSISVLDSNLNGIWHKQEFASSLNGTSFCLQFFSSRGWCKYAYGFQEYIKKFKLDNEGNAFVSTLHIKNGNNDCTILSFYGDKKTSNKTKKSVVIKFPMQNRIFGYPVIEQSNNNDLLVFECSTKSLGVHTLSGQDTITYYFIPGQDREHISKVILPNDLMSSDKFIKDSSTANFYFDSAEEQSYIEPAKVFGKHGGGFHLLFNQQIYSIKNKRGYSTGHLRTNNYDISVSKTGQIEWIKALPMCIGDNFTYMTKDSALMTISRIYGDWTKEEYLNKALHGDEELKKNYLIVTIIDQKGNVQNKLYNTGQNIETAVFPSYYNNKLFFCQPYGQNVFGAIKHFFGVVSFK